ncbi:hypothetical protein [Microbispora sp. GKU 823]|uniref:hypothetical protein n=1 Tax=Microbispora sp. GKU 823 TaxID=1652100 RepID=UPI0009A33523|nr:hypothetical protein [Microbispora sp. GKU 823]OPG11592.1 hypothetical protein B1L11_19345 [Microbispora sp. GKU 823]
MDVTGYGWAGGTLVALGGAPTGTKVFKYTGHVYGSIGDQIFRIDKPTKALTILHTEKGMDGLATDADGNFYYKIGETLRRYVPRKPA